MRWTLGFFAVVVGLAMSGQMAFGQHHHHGGHSYWGSGHHYSPGYYGGHHGSVGIHLSPVIRFGGHHHHGYNSYGYGYGANWYSPIVAAPVYTQPSGVIVNAQPAQPQPQQLPAPRFGAYANVPRVAADLADFANTMCLTMHRRFQNRSGFNATYRVAYSVLQQTQAIRDLSINPANREEIAARLPKIDEAMHSVFADVGGWIGEPNGSTSDDIAALKQDVGQVGAALNYLMVDVGVPHRHQDPAEAARQSQPLPPPPSADRTLLKPVSPSDDPPAPKGDTPLAQPKFGAYANVPKVSADVAMLANRLCLTMHRGFRDRDEFDDAYAAAYSVLQQSQKIRDLARDPGNRDEIAQRLQKLDEGMHHVFADIREWTNDPAAAGNKQVETLKRDFGVLGNAVHYLMLDAGVQHEAHDAETGDPPAPAPKPKTPKPAE